MIQVQDSRGAGTKDNLRMSQVAHASTTQRGEHYIQMAGVPGPILTEVTFYW